MQSIFISYHGGAGGDFLALLLEVGDSAVVSVDISESDREGHPGDMFKLTYNDGTYKRILLKPDGAIKGTWTFSRIGDAYRRYQWDSTVFGQMLLDNKLEELVDELTEKHCNDFHFTDGKDYQITAGHEVIIFSETLGSLDEFTKFCKLNNYDTVVLLTMNSDISKQITSLNAKNKNNSPVDTNTSSFNSFTEMMNKTEHFKIEVEELFNKNIMKSKLKELTYDKWNDKFFDLVYDKYMSKQTRRIRRSLWTL
jgi:hypothetical protein